MVCWNQVHKVPTRKVLEHKDKSDQQWVSRYLTLQIRQQGEELLISQRQPYALSLSSSLQANTQHALHSLMCNASMQQAKHNGMQPWLLSSDVPSWCLVLDGVFDGVAVLDDTGRVVFANNALQAMLGEDGSELIGRNLHELGLPAAKPSATEGATSEPGVINRFETTLAKGAVPRTLMVREATTPIGGRDERRIVLVSDVTQRKRLEEELLRAAANAEAASEAKSRLLGRVSHELRTPLNAVLGFAQLAALDATTPELRDSVIEIQRAGAHLDRLINDLIDVSRSDTGELNIEFEHVDLEAIARESIALMNPVAAGSGITLHIEVGDQVRIIADPGRLMQILLNLLSNAVKYNRQGGAVKVRVGSTADRTYGRIEIEDSGPGISAEEQHRLFTPFERLSNAGDRAGTGIGLALSRILAERMGGEIGVESREGVGSRFWVDFALAPEREQGAWR
jgi:PAS domain S-box-containing protein